MTNDYVDPFTLPTAHERNSLARSLLGHARDCKHCEPLFDQLRLALEGATLSEVTELTRLAEGMG